MSLSLTPSKRPQDDTSLELNDTKIQKTSSSESPKEQRKNSSGGDVFRVLCPSSKIESLAGEGESIISQIRQETGAKVRIDAPTPGCDERVVYIMGPDKAAQNNNEHNNTNTKEPKSTNEQVESEKHDDNVNEQEGSASVLGALLLVLEHFVGSEKQTDGSNEENNGSTTTTFRLLVLSSQVGCLLGRGGSIIKRMATESGAQIRVLPRDKLPQCVSSADDVVQIIGVGDAVKKAVKSVSDQILKNANADHDSLPSNSSGPASNSRSHPTPKIESQSSRPFPLRGASFGGGFRDNADIHSNAPPFFPKFREHIMPTQIDVPDIVTFRLLCPDERVGGIIGKGGAIIKTLKHETGCEIKIVEGSSEQKEREIIVSGAAHPEDKISVVQDAVLRILGRIAKAMPDSREKGLSIKFLVPSNQMVCLLGKDGSIMSELRKVTGAFIHILGEDQLPTGAPEAEVIQISGELAAVQDAVMHITTRLQHHFFRDVFPSAYSDRASAFPSFMGRRELSPKFGPSFRNFDSIGGPAFHGGLHHRDDHPLFMRDVNPHESFERHWPPQALLNGNLMDNGGPHQRRMPGFGEGSQQAIITNTTVEVVVPSSLIPSIRGEDDGCLRQICQISDARIVINEPGRGVPETLIVISGTPEQTHAAQSLIQAFVMLENESS